MPAGPSYSLAGTTCATAGQAWAHPERQLPPHPVGSAEPGGCGLRASREGFCCARSHAHTLGYASKFGDRWQEREILEVPTEAQAWLRTGLWGRVAAVSLLGRGPHSRWPVEQIARPTQPALPRAGLRYPQWVSAAIAVLRPDGRARWGAVRLAPPPGMKGFAFFPSTRFWFARKPASEAQGRRSQAGLPWRQCPLNMRSLPQGAFAPEA